jgi:hypothetical protein
MAYSRAFFDFQLTFAQRLARKFQLPLAEVVYQYTTFSMSFHRVKSFSKDDWSGYLAGLSQADDPTEWTYRWYLDRQGPDPAPDDTTFYEHALFGCFYYTVRTGGIIRLHFVKNDWPGQRPLGVERLAVRQAELRRMFAYIRQHEPTAQAVRGNSWLYNLDAYCRLYPPAYPANMATSEDEDEFQFLALWGQCFDRAWQPKPIVTQELLRRVAALTDLSRLRLCFPYQIRQPECAIEHFYQFYGVS